MAPSIRDISALIPLARQAIMGAVYRTPLEPSTWLTEASQSEVVLKLECYQPTGSFKVRGAAAALGKLSAEERERGVVTASAGNHGLGIAYAASLLGVRATVVTPDEASPAKIAALRRFPVALIAGGASYDDAERTALRIAEETGTVYVSPYNDPWVIAGQGTIGVELLEEMPQLDAVLVPVGGGGLISGIGSWLKAVNPAVRVIGVQASASPAMERALAAGRLVEIPILPTLADGLAANIQGGSITFNLAAELVDEMVLVSEEEIRAGIREAYHELHLALEGSAVVGMAALTNGHVCDVGRVAVIVSGRNIATDRLCGILREE